MTHPLQPLTWQCIRCQRTFTPTPTDPDQTAYAVETKDGKRVGEICRPCYERDDIVTRNP